MIALQIPDDPDRSEMIFASEVKDLLFDLRRHFIRVFVRHRPATSQTRLTGLRVGFAPSIECCSSNPEIPARLAYITDLVSMLQNPKFALYLALISVH